MLPRLKYTAIVLSLIGTFYMGTKVELRSPIIERKQYEQVALNRPIELPPFELSKNIDQREYNRLMNKLAGE